MKNLVTLLVAGLLISTSAYTQELIAVQNGNTPSFYTSLDSAVVNAQNGDTLYLPAGIFSLNLSIDKKLHITGVGYHPDYTNALGLTAITNAITLTVSASGGSLTGLLIMREINSNSEIVSDYSVNRCNLSSIDGNYENLFLAENIIRTSLTNLGCTLSHFYNNIFQENYNWGFANCVFKNNIFLSSQRICFNCGDLYGNGNLLENNVFLNRVNPFFSQGFINSVLRNNLLVYNWVGPDNFNNFFGSGNMVNQPQESIFVNQSGNTYNYDYDYHIKDSSPGKNGGTDGTDVGIYGGVYPWKEGGLPFNPQIQEAKIAPHTNTDGNLNVQIKVAAQER